MASMVGDDTAHVRTKSGFIRKRSEGAVYYKSDSNDPDAVAKHRADIETRYADAAKVAREKAKSKPKDPWAARNNTRVREFERIYQQRYRGIVPDDDAGRSDLIPAIRHIIATENIANARRFAQSWAPWCTDCRFDEIAEEIGPDPVPQKAWPLGKALGLTYELRKYLKIRTIGPCDVTKRRFTQLKKEEDAERKRFKRLLEGGMPREIYKALSKARTEPWKVMGWSERTYYRKREKLGVEVVDAMIADATAKSGRSPSGVNLPSLSRTHLCQSESPCSSACRTKGPADRNGSRPVAAANDNHRQAKAATAA